MRTSELSDPYRGNILVQPLGPIPSRTELLRRITTRPPLPGDLAKVPLHVRLHHLMEVRDLHIPSLEGVRVAETVDLMLRQGYRYRDPSRAATWTIVGNEPSPAPMATQTPPPLAT